MNIYDEYPEVDSNGKRFRWTNLMGMRCQEYMPTVTTTAGTVPMGTKIKKPDFTMIQEKPPVKSCPFVDGISSNCRGEVCAFYDGEKCKPGTAQTGKRCPLRGRLACGEDCAMFDNGCCTLFAAERK